MDFGDILNEWEKRPLPERNEVNKEAKSQKAETKEKNQPKANPIDIWLRRNGIQDKDAEQAKRDPEHISPKKLPTDARLDLHGLSRDEAWIRMDQFIEECSRRGLRKVLIIHGKGNHSDTSPVLSTAARTFIEQDKRLGASGPADRTDGGSGATWVIIRKRHSS